MVGHHAGDLAQRRWGGQLPPGEGVGQVAEQPRSAEAAASHDHAVAPGRPHHGQRVARLPDVAVAQHGDGRHHLLQPGDGIPPGRARIELLGGAGVQGEGHRALALGDAPGFEMSDVTVVDAHAHLDGDRDHPGRRHRGAHDGPEQPGMGG